MQIAVRVTPRAGRTSLAGMREGVLLVRLAAAPVDGSANDALIEFLSNLFDRSKRDVSIVSGQKSRDKRVEIVGLTEQELASKLSDILPR